ncbi:STAS domain-containing protein [Paenibacillus sp. TRM 82003]|uniref:STAS domain-containing protein n=1 Tax=Kineococcus sp. TRM81007 TaxID=2925831 RepID=UPI001F5A1AE4|nr:STAS domain-containing protein [Kineococcus sp. TRM81007]MCI2240004.1 STAS domain-containing protein [Kineococcus sp. TRM81007]MCI3925691.1 STAS domain-containing protein [Paenibacillus sp. TRM 82003]
MGVVSVVSVSGELDAAAVEPLTAGVAAALARSRSVVVDLSGVTFVDCHAIGALVRSQRDADRRGGRLRVAALSDQAQRVFTVLDLHGVLGGDRDVAAECRAAIGGPPPPVERTGSPEPPAAPHAPLGVPAPAAA